MKPVLPRTVVAILVAAHCGPACGDIEGELFWQAAAPTVGFVSSDAYVSEDTGEVRVAIWVEGNGRDFSVDYIVGGDADAADHSLRSGTLAVDGSAAAAEIVFNIIDDTDPEPHETITIELVGSRQVLVAERSLLTITILASEQPGVIVEQPTAEAEWYVGSTRTIVWASQLSTAPVHLFASLDDGGSWSLVAAALPANGSFDWHVRGQATGSARIRADIANGVATYTSEPFALLVGALTITAPTADTQWTLGQDVELAWTSTNLFGSVDVSYLSGGSAGRVSLLTGGPLDGQVTLPAPNEDFGQAVLEFQVLPDGPVVQSDAFVMRSQKSVRYVDASASGANDGSSWQNAHTSLAAALSAAVAGEEVWVVSGTYADAISIPAGVEVYGGFDGTEPERGMRRPAALRPILGPVTGTNTVLMASNTVLDGFEISGGLSPTSGGGVKIGGATNVFIHDVRFFSTDTDVGGGAIAAITSEVTVSNCWFEENHSLDVGGAITIDGGTAVIRDCTFLNNQAALFGGAVHLTGTAHATVTRSTFNHNFADTGGALFVDVNATALVESSIFHDNWGAGSGVIQANGGVTLEGSVVAYNAGALYDGVIEALSATSPFIRNTIFHANADGDLNPTMNASVAHSVLMQTTGYSDLGGNLHAVPTFVNGAGRDLRPAPGSVVIDAGSDTTASPLDFDGQPRRDDTGMPNAHPSAVDIGPFEFQQTTNLRLLSPNGGETLQSGTLLDVTWQYAGTQLVFIELSTDGGSIFTSIAASLPGGTGSASVTLPSETCSACLLRIVDQQGVRDVSDAPFTLQ